MRHHWRTGYLPRTCCVVRRIFSSLLGSSYLYGGTEDVFYVEETLRRRLIVWTGEKMRALMSRSSPGLELHDASSER